MAGSFNSFVDCQSRPMIGPSSRRRLVQQSALRRHLSLGTLAFAVCFAAWGLISAFARRFRERFHLSATRDRAAGRRARAARLARRGCPMGMLADRFGGRLVFSAADGRWSRSPSAWCPRPASYRDAARRRLLPRPRRLVVRGRRGLRLALDPAREAGHARSASTGSGNIGQSAAVFLGPVLAARDRLGERLPRRRPCCSWLGAWSSRCWRATRPRAAPPQGPRRDAARARPRAAGLGAGRVLLPDLRRLRRLLDLPADAAARTSSA